MQLRQQTGLRPTWRRRDEFGKQPDAAGVGKVGRKRKLVLGKLRGPRAPGSQERYPGA